MKKYYILLVALLMVNGTMAQLDKPCSTCLPEGITFETQDQIDDFQVNYPGCTEIEGNVTITGDGITSLTGLEGLISIEGDLAIYLNYGLTSLTGLDNIDAGSITGLVIVDNSLLSTCEVLSICDYLAAPTGIVAIINNSTGCASDEIVIEACEFGVEESSVVSRQSSVKIYPNPAYTNITIELPNISNPQTNTTLTIYNINGQQLFKRQIKEPIINVDVSGLVSGVHFVKVSDDKTMMVGKVVKR
jgi:hypothetical protein